MRVHRNRKNLAVVALAVLVAAGCDAPAEVSVEAPPEVSEQRSDEESVEEPVRVPGNGMDDQSLINECRNDVDGYQVRFPEGWHTNDGSVTAPCQVFAIDPPEIDAATQFPLDVAVLLEVIDRPFHDIEEMIVADPSVDIEGIDRTTIGGQDAIRVDGTTTGEGMLEAGVDLHHTYVAFNGRTVLASAYEFGQPELAERRQIILRMLETLEGHPVTNS